MEESGLAPAPSSLISHVCLSSLRSRNFSPVIPESLNVLACTSRTRYEKSRTWYSAFHAGIATLVAGAGCGMVMVTLKQCCSGFFNEMSYSIVAEAGRELRREMKKQQQDKTQTEPFFIYGYLQVISVSRESSQKGHRSFRLTSP